MNGTVIYRNGQPANFDDFAGPSGAEVYIARMSLKKRTQAVADCVLQGSHTRFIGTPRKAKHRGARFAGVTVK